MEMNKDMYMCGWVGRNTSAQAMERMWPYWDWVTENFPILQGLLSDFFYKRFVLIAFPVGR